MPIYKAGVIYTRCFVQKQLEIKAGVRVSPLPTSGSAGVIHDARRALTAAGARFTRVDLDRTLANFSRTGAMALVCFDRIEAASFVEAVDRAYSEAEMTAGALAVISANPAVALCGFADGLVDSGVRFFIPSDRIIRHGTNIPGYLDAVPALERAAATDSRFSYLLHLFRASLREERAEYRVLFQLVLLEEMADQESGKTLAARLRAFAESVGVAEWLASICAESQVALPEGKDVIDLIVQLRNAAAHSGRLDAEELRKWGGEWALAVLADIPRLHKLLTDVLRHVLCCMVGYGPEAMAVRVTEPLEIRFG